MITVEETNKSRSGNDDERTRRYFVRGTDDDHAALAAARAAIGPLLINGMVLESIDIDEISVTQGLWLAIATYKRIPNEAEATYSFDIGLENVKVKRSLETIASYAPPGKTAPNFANAIAVQTDGRIDGADIQFPLARFSYSLSATQGFVTEAYQAYLEELVGCVNATTFRARAAGSVMFVGATGTQRIAAASKDWSLQFHFVRRPNRSNITIGDISGIDVDGFDLLWPYYEGDLDTEANAFTVSPRAVYVERVAPRADLNQIFRGVPV